MKREFVCRVEDDDFDRLFWSLLGRCAEPFTGETEGTRVAAG